MRVLDLFCGAGGAAMGLHRAWTHAEITGGCPELSESVPPAYSEWIAMAFDAQLAEAA